MEQVGEKLLELLGGVEDLARAHIKSTREGAQKMSIKAELFMMVAILANMAVSLILFFFIARLMTPPIKESDISGVSQSNAGELSRLAEHLNSITQQFRL